MIRQYGFRENLFVDRERKLNGFSRLLQPETTQAVMVIRADEKMGKSWLVSKMHTIFVDEHMAMPAVRIDFRNPLDRSQITDHLSFVRLLRDRIDQPQHFAKLNDVINRLTAEQAASTRSRPLADLAEEIQSRYTSDELRQTARFLDVEWENLAGNRLWDRAYSFVLSFYQRNELDRLFEWLRDDRPNVEWAPHAIAIDKMTHEVEPEEPTSGDIIDQGRRLVAKSAIEERAVERELNQAFITSLYELMAHQDLLIFIFDAQEKAPSSVQRFVVDALIPHLLDERLQNVKVIIAGRSTPDFSDLEVDHLLIETGLDPFTEEHIRDFMSVRQISEEPPKFTWSGVLLLSGGVPGDLALMADKLTAQASQEDPFFDAL